MIIKNFPSTFITIILATLCGIRLQRQKITCSTCKNAAIKQAVHLPSTRTEEKAENFYGSQSIQNSSLTKFCIILGSTWWYVCLILNMKVTFKAVSINKISCTWLRSLRELFRRYAVQNVYEWVRIF